MITKGTNRQDWLWEQIEDSLEELGVSDFYVPENLQEEMMLESFLECIRIHGPVETMKRLDKVKKKKK
jgi:hypothetical protein